MNHERKFFANVAGAINPGWNIRINDARAEAGDSLSARDTLFYVVDVATGWTAAGALDQMTSDEAVAACRGYMALLGDEKTAALTAADLAGRAIVLCGAGQLESSAKEVELAIATAAAAMVETRTYQLVRAANAKARKPELAGHWVYLAYRMGSSTDIVTHPAYLSGGMAPGVPDGRFMTPEVLVDMVEKIIRVDTSEPLSLVGSTLASGGGAVISKRWRP